MLSVEEFRALTIACDKEVYKTGEQVNLTVTSSAAGKTQLAVAVIDEAVLDLVPDVDDLYDPQGKRFAGLLEVWSSYRWWQLSRALVAKQASSSGLGEISEFLNFVVADSGGTGLGMYAGAMSASQGLVASGPGGVPLRHNFVEAAYFNPNVLTSDAGIAEIGFTVPDNLGRWRVVVVGTNT